MCKTYLGSVSVVLGLISICSAAVAPISSVVTDNPEGSPPYNIQSVTVGSYTVDRSQLANGTSTRTLAFDPGDPIPELDDLDLSFAWSNGETGNQFTVHMFNGELWSNSNGDEPDFFLFEAGTGDGSEIAAILPGGVIGQSVTLSGGWGSTGHNSNGQSADGSTTGNGQAIVGISWAITDLLDDNGNALTNDSIIEGIAVTSRNGMDPADWFAVAKPLSQAREPHPEDEATDVIRDITLTWEPGWFASQHIVYFGTDFDDVNNGADSVKVGSAQDVVSYDPPGLLDFGQRYFWRVDEVNDSHPDSPWKGEVWSFTVEPFAYAVQNIVATSNGSPVAGAGPENTVNGSGLNANDEHSIDATEMWLATPGADPLWIQYEFDRAYKLHEVLIWNYNVQFELMLGFGLKSVTVEYSTDGVDWIVLGDIELGQGTAIASYTANTAVDFGGAEAQYVRLNVNSGWGPMGQYGLSEVRFLYIPTFAREPHPADSETEVAPNTTLSWRAGREAAAHEVYLGTDPTALTLLDTTAEPTLAPDGLEFGTVYYWKVGEVNDAEVPSVWESDLWTFTTQEFGVIDDFESYDDEANVIYETWIDGWVNETGSTVGYLTAPFAEQSTVHSGSQSMPLFYENSGGTLVSEATLEFDDSQDWTRAGVQTLLLHFFGNPDNTGGQLYVTMNDVKVPYSGATGSLARPWWTQWNIDLSSVNVNLRSVTSLTIGIEGSGSGVVYVDDIRLYREAPVAAQEEIWIEAEGAESLGSLWTTADDGAASGGQYVGSEDGDGDDNDIPPDADWHASYTFTVAGGTYKLAARIITSPGNSFWVRIGDATSPQIAREDGWINTNPMDAGDAWHWDEIHDQQIDNVVHFTLSAGEHTLEIAKREDGTLLDAIVITDKLD